MLQDFDVVGSSARDLTGENRPNVCIVGAGAAGILLATQLAARGLTVLLLEGGGLELEDRSQALYKTELSGLPYAGATEGRFRTYGGSTTRWGGQILELEEFDFEPREHVKGSGWPFPKKELTGYYERALEFEGLRLTERDDAKVWAGLGLSICDLGPEFKMEYSRWCPERDFAILQRRMLQESRRLRVLFHANVTGFALNDSSTAIEALKVRGYMGAETQVSADCYVICTGGIETVRLLLQPLEHGLAPWQANGLLGKHYQDHIALNEIDIREISTQPAQRYFGYAPLGGFRYHNKIRLSLAEQARAKTLNVAGTVGPFRREDPARERALVMLRELVKQGKKPSPSQWKAMAGKLPGIAFERGLQRLLGDEPAWSRTMLTVHCEQSPLSASSITLGEERDALGMLRANVKWEISEQEIHSLRTYVKRATAVFAARRFAKVEPPKGFYEDDDLVVSMCGDSNHHMGGARMATSNREGVVDTNLKLHGIGNGYLLTSAVFPTVGFSNPTHTLVALSMRLGDHLMESFSERGVSLTSPLEVREPMRLVALSPQKTTTQLGFGCSYLLGPGIDRAKSLRLLEAAYDAGVRHFDTARLYGQGECEALLGEFLRRKPAATVTTKFGLEPPNLLQRSGTAAGRRVRGLEGLAKRLRGNGKVTFNAKGARASLERSLRALGREQVELFLLHEPERTDLVHDDLLAFLEEARAAGKIGNFGIGGEYSRVTELYATRRAYTPLMQFEHSIFGPALTVPESVRVHYRTFARAASALTARFAADRRLGWWWSEMVGADLQEPQVLAQLLLRASLDESPDALNLFSTSVEQHIYENAAVAQDSALIEPARRLRKLVREDDLGVGAELYG